MDLEAFAQPMAQVGTRRIEPGVLRWILRLLVLADGHETFLEPYGYKDHALARALCLPMSGSYGPGDFDLRVARQALFETYARSDVGDGPDAIPDQLARNLRLLADRVGLGDIDSALLGFGIMVWTEPLLRASVETIGQVRSEDVATVLGTVLSIQPSVLRYACSPSGRLASTGLIQIADRISGLHEKVVPLSVGFAEGMRAEIQDPADLLRDTIVPGAASTLALGDFEHRAEHIQLLAAYLRHALDQRKLGANVLIYGPPGTGKTELARSLAVAVDAELFEVACEDEGGYPLSADQRLRASRLGQAILGQGRTLFLCDECEDAFDLAEGIRDFGRPPKPGKAWLNRLLESNPAPTIWICNRQDRLDAAFLRRFDIIVDMPVPPLAIRARIFSAQAGALVDTQTVARLASVDSLAPAVVSRASAVVGAVRHALAPDATSRALKLLVNGTLVAQGHPGVHGHTEADEPPRFYDAEYISADTDLERVACGLMTGISARLCLHGPPGTGKSAWARHLAERLGRPLISRSASEIISCVVGETEQNIARAFRAAAAGGAVLLFDEVDSFLNTRRDAIRTWEITEVNEMLSRLEGFEGLVIATTNRLQALDPAALRRFDLKVAFGYLKMEPAWKLFASTCTALGMGTPGLYLKERAADLTVLALGDFAAVARRHRFLPMETPEELMDALAKECDGKNDGPRRPIGFMR